MRINIVIALLAALVASGCGGGSSSPQGGIDPGNATGDGATDVLAYGTITRFDSVVANGTVFDSDTAAVTMNDAPANLADLRVGHVVAITATTRSQDQNAVAQRIGLLDEVTGPITGLNLANNSFVALGRTVFFDELTVFENLAYDDLNAGNVVRVIGRNRHQNQVQATHVERIANAYVAGMQMTVKGEISDLDLALMQFRIGSQLCVYSAAMLDLGSADLANGLYVEVSSSAPLAGGSLILDRVRARDRDRDRDRDHQCDSGCEFDLEGFVTEFVSPTDFYVDGAPVTTTSSTVYVNGTESSLALDVLVAVSGTMNDAGVLVADRIVFRLISNIQIEADVEAIDTNDKTVRLLGIEVATNDFTMFRDISDAAVVSFWLDDLAVGDRVAVRAYLAGDVVLATRLERDDAESGVILKAPVEAIARPSVTMLGVTATADDNTVLQNADKEIIDIVEFFDLVEVGSLVRAAGEYNGTALLADSLFIRECRNSCL